MSPILPVSPGNGDLRLAGDAGLAEAAGRSFESIPRLDIGFQYVVEVVEAFLLVMAPLLADGVRGAPFDAFAAAAIEIIEAVRMVIVVGSH